MGDWKSCDNCGVFPLTIYCTVKTNTVICDYWKPIPCKYCGGPLSEIREHNGRKYRHCYSCHSEFFEEVKACDTAGI